MIAQPRCPSCRQFVYLNALRCPKCDDELGYHLLKRQFFSLRRGQTVIDGQTWYACSNRGWDCNWLVWEGAPAGRCFSCRLTRNRPDNDDTVALGKLATTEEAKRRLILQLGDLGLPLVPWDVEPGGLGFDLLSSISLGRRVSIGHANGIITIDLAETLDDVDTYSHNFEPYDPETFPAQLSDDLTSIAADLANGLRHFRAGNVVEALWWWQFSYLASWGTNACGVLSALHSIVAHDRLDAELPSEADQIEAAADI